MIARTNITKSSSFVTYTAELHISSLLSLVKHKGLEVFLKTLPTNLQGITAKHLLSVKRTYLVCNYHPQICPQQTKSQPAFSKSYFLLWGVSVLTEWYLVSFLWGTDGDVSTGPRDSWLSVGKWLNVFARLRKLCWGNGTACSREESSVSPQRSPTEPLVLTAFSAGSVGSLSFSFSHNGGS